MSNRAGGRYVHTHDEVLAEFGLTRDELHRRTVSMEFTARRPGDSEPYAVRSITIDTSKSADVLPNASVVRLLWISAYADGPWIPSAINKIVLEREHDVLAYERVETSPAVRDAIDNDRSRDIGPGHLQDQEERE